MISLNHCNERWSCWAREHLHVALFMRHPVLDKYIQVVKFFSVPLTNVTVFETLLVWASTLELYRWKQAILMSDIYWYRWLYLSAVSAEADDVQCGSGFWSWNWECCIRQLGSSRVNEWRNSKDTSWRTHQTLHPWHLSCWSVSCAVLFTIIIMRPC